MLVMSKFSDIVSSVIAAAGVVLTIPVRTSDTNNLIRPQGLTKFINPTVSQAITRQLFNAIQNMKIALR